MGRRPLQGDVEDGILTALGIPSLNLWGTDLVALSACETGVGVSSQGERDLGVRRAFQLAGVRTAIML
jgi:CHAT domain-containing protein